MVITFVFQLRRGYEFDFFIYFFEKFLCTKQFLLVTMLFGLYSGKSSSLRKIYPLRSPRLTDLIIDVII